MKTGGGKSFSHIVAGGMESFHSFQVLPCLEGGRKDFRTRDFPISYPPLPVINDQSLRHVLEHLIGLQFMGGLDTVVKSG